MPKKVSKTAGADKKKKPDFESFMAAMRKNDAFIDLTAKEEEFFKFGDYNLDRALGGGLPSKSIYAFQGPSGCGKTLAALQISREVVNKGRRVLYFDVENKLSALAQKKFGLFNNENFQIFSVATQEDAIATLMEVIEAGFFGLIVVDSIDALATEEQLERDVHEGSKVGGYQAKTWSEWLRIIPNLSEKYDCSVLLLRQVRDNPGVMYGSTETTSGGRAVEFYSTTVLRFGPDKEGNQVEDGRIVYQGAKVRILKMNQGALPKEPVAIRFYIGDNGPWGIDTFSSVVDEAKRLGVLGPLKAGSHKYVPCDELLEKMGSTNPDDYSFNGRPNTINALMTNPELFDAVEELVEECDGKPIRGGVDPDIDDDEEIVAFEEFDEDEE